MAAGILAADPGANVGAELKAGAKRLRGEAQDGSLKLLANTVGGGCVVPTASPVPSASPTECDGVRVLVNVTTDDYPAETSWDLVDMCDGRVLDSTVPGGYTGMRTIHEKEVCYPMTRFKFTIKDDFDDGLCCGFGLGGYEVSLDGELQDSGGGGG